MTETVGFYRLDIVLISRLVAMLSVLTIEDMKQGTSRIRNYVIARVFRELHLIEQWGTGVRRIFEKPNSRLQQYQLVDQ